MTPPTTRSSARRLHARARWRSHTFADGVHAITLTGSLDSGAADLLHARLFELMARGCDRLIVDLTAADRPGSEERLLLAAVLELHEPGVQVVLVLPWRSALEDLLPAGLAVAQTFGEARRMLDPEQRARDRRERLGPGGAIAPRERNALAVRQALRWADLAAAEGDHDRALEWLATVEAVERRLPPSLERRRRAWRDARRVAAVGERRAPH